MDSVYCVFQNTLRQCQVEYTFTTFMICLPSCFGLKEKVFFNAKSRVIENKNSQRFVFNLDPHPILTNNDNPFPKVSRLTKSSIPSKIDICMYRIYGGL